ncbi:DUF72 domain-containing protein [Pararhizobium sp. O133]|uniref:DUF72 domain-containing protein n=1 Tax=Pararhizobium sp. O133 TaxID=3449278 RepID=UPI003F68819E
MAAVPGDREGPVIATAAWSIPKTVTDRFPDEGSGLSRYAAVFRGVEVNSTFYRRHRPTTFERWAAAVPDDFRFAVKLPRDITHVLRLKHIDEALLLFLGDIAPLREKLGPLLCQLPPSLPFHEDEAKAALAAMRLAHAGPIVIEVRHGSWASDRALSLLEHHNIGRVLADPALVWTAADFIKPPSYMRLHGSPKVYHSSYADEQIRSFLGILGPDSWCVFDNTASGAAIENALTMRDLSSVAT